MIELQRHIEILLLSNDCVIVPDFGGFITHSEAARYEAREKLFLPPLRTLGFNPQLRMNDSVLVQSYVEAYDLSYPEALRRIEKEVDELKNQLEEEGHYLLDNLGELSVNQDGNYEFVPCESGILSPELYGLGSFQFKRLKDEAVTEETVQPLKTVAKSISLSKTDAEETQLLDFIDDDKIRDEDDSFGAYVAPNGNEVSPLDSILRGYEIRIVEKAPRRWACIPPRNPLLGYRPNGFDSEAHQILEAVRRQFAFYEAVAKWLLAEGDAALESPAAFKGNHTTMTQMDFVTSDFCANFRSMMKETSKKVNTGNIHAYCQNCRLVWPMSSLPLASVFTK